MRVILLGPPGAGKGTHAEALSQKLKVLRISTGDILRENVKNSTPIGRKAKKYMERGELVPDEIVTRMTMDRIAKLEGFILDGFPRTLEQARSLDECLRKLGSGIDLVVNFEMSEATIIERLSGRRMCEACGANYHIKNIPTRKPGVCDRCGGQLFQRDDDRPETIRKRLEVYRGSSSEVTGYYKEKGVMETTSGELDVERGYETLIKLFEEKGLL